MAARTAQQRREWEEHLASIPWIDRVTEDKPCDGVKWSQVAIKHLYSRGGKPAEGIPDRARCKFKAKWHFVALPNSWSKDGDYCIHHLAQQVTDDTDESDRYQRWIDEQPK